MFPSKKIQINYVMKAAEIMLLYCYEKKKKKKFINLINEDCDIYRKTDLLVQAEVLVVPVNKFGGISKLPKELYFFLENFKI